MSCRSYLSCLRTISCKLQYFFDIYNVNNGNLSGVKIKFLHNFYEMNFICQHLHCGKILLESTDSEIQELTTVISDLKWPPNYSIETSTTTLRHQAAYNRSITSTLSELGWNMEPRLSDSPRLIGDFAKGLVFGEIQSGNSATLYRDFCKFQHGLQNGLLSLAILIVPHDEYKFFPTPPASVKNMANFALALSCFTVLPISVPTIIYGLLADSEKVSDPWPLEILCILFLDIKT